MEQKNEISYLKSVRCQDVYTDSCAEYVLPDYNGDVRRILYTGATVRPAGSFTGDGEVVYSGIVVYDVVYLDGEGALSSVSFTSDYELSSKCPTDSLFGAYADTRVANFAVRPVGPRKISAKATLTATPHAVIEHTYAPDGDAFSEHFVPERLTRVANIRKSCVSETVEREYAEEALHIDGAIADELSVIHAALDPIVEEMSNDSDEIAVRGNFLLSLTIKNGDEAAYREEKKIPFDFSVSSPYPDTQLITPIITVPSLTTSVNADEDGVGIVVNFIAEMHAVCDGNEPVELVSDAYLVERDTENSYSDLSYTELVGGERVTENVNLEFLREGDELSRLREVIIIDAIPKIGETVRENGRTYLTGDMRIVGVISTTEEDGRTGYAPIKLEAPFRIPLRGDGAGGDDASAEISISAHTPHLTIDSSHIGVAVPVTLDVRNTRESCVKILASSVILPGEITKPCGSLISVYYPTAGDTLFDIAKRYRTTPNRIAATNALSVSASSIGDADSVGFVKKLVIIR